MLNTGLLDDNLLIRGEILSGKIFIILGGGFDLKLRYSGMFPDLF